MRYGGPECLHSYVPTLHRSRRVCQGTNTINWNLGTIRPEDTEDLFVI